VWGLPAGATAPAPSISPILRFRTFLQSCHEGATRKDGSVEVNPGVELAAREDALLEDGTDAAKGGKDARWGDLMPPLVLNPPQGLQGGGGPSTRPLFSTTGERGATAARSAPTEPDHRIPPGV